MKKKILGIVLSLTMVGAMLAGCGQQQGAEDKKEETKKRRNQDRRYQYGQSGRCGQAG